MTSFLPVEQVAERINQIRETIPNSVQLIAVTKQVPVALIRAAYEAGLRHFGESRVQEVAAKQSQLQELTDVTWHMIGHLQSNKAAKVLQHCQWIHSVDSLKLAQRLNQLAAEQSQKPKVFLQVKILPDPNKYGWTVPDLMADLPLLNDCTHLEIVGLMTIPPYEITPSQTREVFLQTQALAVQIQQQPWSHIKMQHLSMGMSDDYPLAIEAGATFVRLGRTLFGERSISQ